MASKKKDGLLGPDGRAVAQAFSGLGQKWNEYTKWRAEREKRIQSKQGEATKPKPKPKPKPESQKPGYIPADKRPADMRVGQVYGSRSGGRNWSNPHGQKSNKPSEGDRSTWGTKPKPKPDPKPSPKPQPTRTRSSGSTTRPTTTTPKPTAPKPTAKPKPAAKVYGSTGRKDLKQSARMRDALKNLKVRDYGGSKKKPAPEPKVSRPKPPSSLSKPKPTPEPKVSRPKPPSSLSKPKPTATKPKPTASKPKPAKQKPLAVDVNNIPKNLNSPAGRKYLADLDAGKLTRKRK